MKEQGELENTGGTLPLPIGNRKAWISIHWEELGAERTHDFSNVREMARFLLENPELAKLFGYTRRN